MSKTPRTDEQAGALIDAEEVVPADFARELERENAALRQQAEFGANMLVKAAEQKQRADKIEAENADLRSELKRQGALWQATHALGLGERDFAIKCIETALSRKEEQI